MDKLSEDLWKELVRAEENANTSLPKAKAVEKDQALQLGHLSGAVLLERAAYLRKLAKLGEGSSGETLKEHPNHCFMLSVRQRSGEAEVHENFADIFYVLDGRATMVTGGTVTGAKIVSPGETRGSGIEGGKSQELRAGDIAHVPAGLPHQMIVTHDKGIACLVVKVQEKPLN